MPTGPATVQNASPGVAPAATTPVAGARARQEWVDVARGFVVVMVVIMHVGIYHFTPMAEGSSAEGFWSQVSAVLQVVRMPALLVLSGWLAGSRIRAGLGSARTRRSIFGNAYLYVLWLAIYTVAAVALGATTMAQAPAPSTYLTQLLLPYSTLWFLAALAWYTAGLAALRRVPAPIVLTGLFALGWASTAAWPVTEGLWANIPHMATFFAVGVYARPVIASIGSHPLAATVGGVVASVLAGELARPLEAVGTPTYPLTFVQSLAGVAAVFGFASLATRLAPRLVRPMGYVGRRTLPIYVVHYLVIMAVTTTAGGPLYELDRALIFSEAGRWAYPLVLTGAIVALGVGLKELSARAHLGWLFVMPHRPARLRRATRTAGTRAGGRAAERLGRPSRVAVLSASATPLATVR